MFETDALLALAPAYAPAAGGSASAGAGAALDADYATNSWKGLPRRFAGPAAAPP